jgi:endonuclease-8
VGCVRARHAVAALAPAGLAGAGPRRPRGRAVRRARDQRLAALGPDILADEFEADRFLARLRGDDYTRGIGDALLDQRNVAGIGNFWKSEGCWDAAIDPWRPVSALTDAEALSIIDVLRPRMLESARTGVQDAGRRVFRRHGEACSRCATKLLARGQGEGNRTTFWCPGCQH